MSMENVKQFLELVKTDEGLARKVVELKDSLQGGAGSEVEILAEKVLPLAKAHGLEFTVEEFLAYANSVSGELSDDDLLNVSGGISARGVALGLLFATGLSFVPSILSSFAEGPGGSVPSAPETYISQSYDAGGSLQQDDKIDVDAAEDNQGSSQLQAAREKVERLQQELSRKKRGKSTVSKGYMKNLQELEKAKANVERLEKIEREKTENNKKDIVSEIQEFRETKKDQQENMGVALADNQIEEHVVQNQTEMNAQVENKEDELEKKDEVVEEKKEEKKDRAEEKSVEQMKAELVNGLKDNSLVYSSKGEIKGFESDIYVAMKNAKILNLNEPEQKQMLTDAIKDVLSESSEEQISSFANATIDNFSSAKKQATNKFELKSGSGITDRSSVVKQIQVKDKIDELSDTYGGTMSAERKNKLDELKTQASGATQEKLAEIEKTLKETEKTLKNEAEQYNAKLKELNSRLIAIDDDINGLSYVDKDTDALSQKYSAIEAKMSSENFDLTQVENEIKELKDLVDQVDKEKINLKQVKFAGETLRWDGTIENLYNCLKAADFDIDRIKDSADWTESCEKALKTMTVYNDTLQIYQRFGTSCGSNVKDYKHKAMLKTLALFAMEGYKQDGAARKVADPSAAKAEDVQLKDSDGLKEFVEGKK